MRVSRDTDSEIHTAVRGRRYATSIEGTFEAERARSIEWYRSTSVTRPDDTKAARVVVSCSGSTKKTSSATFCSKAVSKS